MIAREIARGGMGRVLEARDRRLGREVAIKEVLATTGTLARRFEREVRITARLQHPSIVSVHEAGSWHGGQPFYAMPLVSGRSLEEVIAAAKTNAERLALVPNVLAIADAMAYAHGKRVIHRDLKPKNVVVGDFGETIVLDWGVAKQLDVDSPADPGEPAAPVTTSDSGGSETSAGDLLGTPAYMPPEQAAGPAVDERADVYAIGAILYHVLAGRPPYVAETVGDLLAMLATRPPPSIAHLAPDAPSELVAIVEHAMKRDPAARYPTARELAEDLRRFQTGQLVGAHRYSLRQLLGRWARRHITVIAAIAAAIVVGLGIGILAVTKVLDAEHVAEEQRALAVANRTDAVDLMRFMLVDLRGKLKKVGRLDLLETVARKASAYYDTHGATSDADALMDADARLGIAKVIEHRGDLRGARAELDKVKASLDLLAASRPWIPQYELRALDIEYEISDIQSAQGDRKTALASARHALARAEGLRAGNPKVPEVVHAVAIGHERLSSLLESLGQLDAALAESRLHLATSLAERDQLVAHAEIGKLLLSAKHDVAGSLAEQQLALDIGLREAAKDPKDTSWLEDLAISYRDVAALKEKLNHTDPLPDLRASLAIEERLVKLDPANADWQSSLAIAQEQIGTALLARHDVAGARAAYEANAAIWTELIARDPTNADWQRNTSVAINKVGDVQVIQGDWAGAQTSFTAALAIRSKLVAKDPSNSRWQRDLFYSHIELADLADKRHDPRGAAAELRAALDVAEPIAAAHPKHEGANHDVSATSENLGDELALMHDAKGAREAYAASLAISERFAAEPKADPAWQQLVSRVSKKLAGQR